MTARYDADPTPLKPRPSATRSASLRRARLSQEAKRGNTNALKHGIFARVHNAQDIANEAAIVFAAHPDLDPVADHRLVEALAIASVHHARAVLAIDEQGYQSTLVAAARDFGNRQERLERAVHERDRERRKARQASAAVDLDRYRPKAVSE